MSNERLPTEIKVNPIPDNTVILTYLDRETIFLDPDYQRQSDVWSVEKKQLLIDSIINRFDIPKFYLHEFEKPKLINGKTYKYALVDGKQRLTAIWSFINNEYPLSKDIKYLADPNVDLRGLTYSELSRDFPRISAYFDGRPLSLMAVRADDIELIEEMFTRLNEAVPLNAPEKRNAFGGPIPPIIRKLSAEDFFTQRLPFTNRRYRHFDLACKFLYLSDVGGPEDTKKVHLDLFVKKYKKEGTSKKVTALRNDAVAQLSEMNRIFVNNDSLLKNVGNIVVYYLLFRRALAIKALPAITRKKFVDFEDTRRRNSILAAEDIEKADYNLLRFDGFNNYVNDKFAIKYKYDVFAHYVFRELELPNSEFIDDSDKS